VIRSKGRYGWIHRKSLKNTIEREAVEEKPTMKEVLLLTKVVDYKRAMLERKKPAKDCNEDRQLQKMQPGRS
jgi:hypothetical protein